MKLPRKLSKQAGCSAQLIQQVAEQIRRSDALAEELFEQARASNNLTQALARVGVCSDQMSKRVPGGEEEASMMAQNLENRAWPASRW